MAVFAFDLLYLNGEALVRKPFKERRQLLQDHFHSVEGEFHFAKSADPETMEEVQELLEESVKGIINIIFFLHPQHKSLYRGAMKMMARTKTTC